MPNLGETLIQRATVERGNWEKNPADNRPRVAQAREGRPRDEGDCDSQQAARQGFSSQIFLGVRGTVARKWVVASFPSSAWERETAKLCFASPRRCLSSGRKRRRKQSFQTARSQALLGNEGPRGKITTAWRASSLRR